MAVKKVGKDKRGKVRGETWGEKVGGEKVGGVKVGKKYGKSWLKKYD
jgi:hypothetical protein